MKLEYFADEEVPHLDEEMERESKLITGLIKFLKKPVQRSLPNAAH